MARGINKVILVGTLGRDPEVRHLPSGDAMANVSLATSESWKDKSTGEKKEVTEWHKVVFFKRLAEIAGEYLRKGQQVYIEGSLKTRSWEKDGVKQYTVEIVASNMQMLGGRQDGERTEQPAPKPAPPPKPAAPAPRSFEDFDDDIPF